MKFNIYTLKGVSLKEIDVTDMELHATNDRVFGCFSAHGEIRF